MSNALIDRAWPLAVSSTDKIVLLYLADRANAAGTCWPSVATIAASASLSDRAVQMAIKRLEEGGHLSQFWHTPEKAKRPMRHFRIHPRTTFTPEADLPPNEVHHDPERGSPLPPNDVHHPPEPRSPKSPVNPKGNQKETSPPNPLRGEGVGSFADWVVSEWNRMAAANQRPMATMLSPKVAAKLQAALSRDDIERAIGMIPRSPFLMGNKGNWSGATFAWFTKAGNAEKILNGGFHYGPVFNTGNDRIDGLLLKRWETERCTKTDGATKAINLDMIDRRIQRATEALQRKENSGGPVIDAEFNEVIDSAFWGDAA